MKNSRQLRTRSALAIATAAALAVAASCSEDTGVFVPPLSEDTPPPATTRDSGARAPTSTEDHRMRVSEAIADPQRACAGFMAAYDKPIAAELPLEVVLEGQRICAGVGYQIEQDARPFAQDPEQAHAISVCSAAYTEYEHLLSERLQSIGYHQEEPSARDLAIETMQSICTARLHGLAR